MTLKKIHQIAVVNNHYTVTVDYEGNCIDARGKDDTVILPMLPVTYQCCSAALHMVWRNQKLNVMYAREVDSGAVSENMCLLGEMKGAWEALKNQGYIEVFLTENRIRLSKKGQRIIDSVFNPEKVISDENLIEGLSNLAYERRGRLNLLRGAGLIGGPGGNESEYNFDGSKRDGANN